MELSDLRKLQLLEVNLLLKFQEICKENKLNYYFVGGGLIGALRHGGFIPWDDDLDIVMPRNDYDRFLTICKENTEEGYGINSDWYYLFANFVDLESFIEYSSEFETKKKNIWIDVFPIDGMPKCKFRSLMHTKLIFGLRYLLILSNTERLVGKKERRFYESWILNFCNSVPLFNKLNSEKICYMMEKHMRKYSFEVSDYGCNFLGKYRYREIQPRKRWGTPATLLFEGIKVKVPELYHEFQTHIYGDYMKLPPESKRVAHNPILLKHRDIDFNTLEQNSIISRKIFQ